MVRSNRSRIGISAALLVLAAGASACATPDQLLPNTVQTHVRPISGSSPYAGPSLLAEGFQCARESMAGAGNARIAISQIKDETGKFSYEGQLGGSIVTQGATQMAIRALGEFDGQITQVERYDMRISELETNLSERHLIRDGDTVRGMTAGQFEGTDYYITGAITEFNSNIYSGGSQIEINQTGFGGRVYVANIVVDVRLVRTRDLVTIGRPVSISKQIRGFETKAGTFDFFGSKYLFDLNMGNNSQEPVQLAVRSATERAIMELVPRAVGASFNRCVEYTDTSFDQRATNFSIWENAPLPQ